jgi:thiamine biosynthesis lipoprotein
MSARLATTSNAAASAVSAAFATVGDEPASAMSAPLAAVGAPASDLRTWTVSAVGMDTLISARIDSARPEAEIETAAQAALGWFAVVERACSRFNPESELMQLCARVGEPVVVGPLLFEALAFALEVARATGGAFDPTVGGAQQARGIRRNYVTGKETNALAGPASYRDVRLNRRRRSVTLRRPLLLDLGAVAKGLAIDLAARELAGFERYAVEAGGDLFAGAATADATSWRIGIRDPFSDGLRGSVELLNRAVCTSAGDERPLAEPGEHHLLDPRTGRSPRALASVSVIAPSALVADALATAAFVLGPDAGLRLLDEQAVHGVLITAENTLRLTGGIEKEMSWSPLSA